jgi:hypothetical protein
MFMSRLRVITPLTHKDSNCPAYVESRLCSHVLMILCCQISCTPQSVRA